MEAGLRKRGDALSAFLLAAKLRIDVSRSIHNGSPRRSRRATRLTPFVKKKKKKWCIARCQRTATASPRVCNILGASWFAGAEWSASYTSREAFDFLPCKKKRNAILLFIYFSDQKISSCCCHWEAEILRHARHAPRATRHVRESYARLCSYAHLAAACRALIALITSIKPRSFFPQVDKPIIVRVSLRTAPQHFSFRFNTFTARSFFTSRLCYSAKPTWEEKKFCLSGLALYISPVFYISLRATLSVQPNNFHTTHRQL